ALFAFAISFDEVVTVLLLGAPHQRTIQREMFSGLPDSFNPTIAADPVMLTLVAVLLLLVVELLRGRSERMKQQSAGPLLAAPKTGPCYSPTDRHSELSPKSFRGPTANRAAFVKCRTRTAG